MAFAYVLTSLGGVERSELPGAREKTIALPVAAMATAGVRLRLDHRDADTLLDGDNLLKVYETDVPGLPDPVLRFHGRQTGGQEVAQEGNAGVTATFADPFWVLLRRLCGKSPLGYTNGTALAPVDRGAIIADLLSLANAEEPSGVRLGALEASSPTHVAGWHYQKIGEKIAELAATLDGPDWRVRPVEYDAGAYGELDVLASLGQTRSDAAFEYGDGRRTVASYTRAVSLEGTVNRAYNLPPGFPENATQEVLAEEDAASRAERGLLEDVVAADLTVDDLRRALLRHHINVRRGPRQVIEFELSRDLGRGPRFGVDFDLGDVCPFRARVDGRDRFDGDVRVYQWQATIDEFGNPSPKVTVTPA